MPTVFESYQAGPDTSNLEDIDDYTTFVRVVSESHPGFRGANITARGRHGALRTSGKTKRPLIIPLEVGIRYTDSAGAVTTSAAEHAHENHVALKRLFGDGRPAVLRRDAPYTGVVETTVELLASAEPSQNRATYLYLLEASDPPYWRSTSAATTATASPIVAGDYSKPGGIVVKFFNGTDVTLTVDSTGESVGFEGTVPAAGHQIDVEAGTATAISGGADVSTSMTCVSDIWFELFAGSNAVTYAGGGTWSVDWYDQWS